jgi:hypothetical protein
MHVWKLPRQLQEADWDSYCEPNWADAFASNDLLLVMKRFSFQLTNLCSCQEDTLLIAASVV